LAAAAAAEVSGERVHGASRFAASQEEDSARIGGEMGSVPRAMGEVVVDWGGGRGTVSARRRKTGGGGWKRDSMNARLGNS